MDDKVYVWDFMEKFATALTDQLKDDQKVWGDTWRKRVILGHEDRIYSHLTDYYDQWKNGGVPIPWLKVAGLAMIAWIRENHPEALLNE
jgi:hypothetical protein